MRVLIASPAYVIDTYREKLCRLASFPDVEIALLVPGSWRHPLGPIIFRPSGDDAVYHQIPLPVYFSGRNGKFMFRWLAAASALLRFRPHIIHVEVEPLSMASLQLTLLSRLLVGAKIIQFKWENLDLELDWLRRAVEGVCIRAADHFIAGNSAARTLLVNKGVPAGRISVMPQVGISMPDGAAPASRPSAGSQFTVGFVGRLVKEKGVFTLLNAFADLPSQSRLVLVGDGPARHEIVRTARSLGILGRLEVTGALRQSKVAAQMAAMHVMVLPSLTTPRWSEQFGRVIIEAMASGVPVVGSDSGAIPEVLGDAGLVFEEANAPALAATLNRLLEDRELRQELSHRGLDRCRRHFTHEHIAEVTRRIYRSVLGQQVWRAAPETERDTDVWE